MRGEGGFSRVRGVPAHGVDRKLVLATTLIGLPSPLPSPHSSVVGRGNRTAAWRWYQDALLRSHGHKFFLANRRHHLNKSLLFEKRWTLRPSVTAVKCLGTPRESGTVAPL